MTKAKLKARSHILSLLGDELIGSDALAVFELVKNSYDADATNVDIIFEGIGTDNQKLTIKDNGHGMTSEVIDKVWLTLGTDFKFSSILSISLSKAPGNICNSTPPEARTIPFLSINTPKAHTVGICSLVA